MLKTIVGKDMKCSYLILNLVKQQLKKSTITRKFKGISDSETDPVI